MKDWTIMVYMAGDNNLSMDMAYALEEIRESVKSSGDKLNLMVYYDSSSISAPTIYCDFTDYENPVYVPSYAVEKTFESSKPRKFRRKNNESILTDDNSAAVYSILNFVDWCVNKSERRAEKYALIFSGHSTAFQNMSFLVDTSSDYYMTIPKLRWALKQITRKDPPYEQDTLLLGQKIDILGFDSCVMGMLELGYGFNKYAGTMVASEGNIPSAGWTYGEILTGLTGSPECETETEIAASFVTNFIKQQSKYIIGGASVDLAAWDLSKVEGVVAATDKLGGKLNEILKDGSSENQSNLKKALLTCHWECQSYMLEQNIDLKDFCQLLQIEVKDFDPEDGSGLAELCGAVIEAIDACILMCGFSGSKYQYSNGISLFFPWNALAFYSSKENYEDLAVFRENKLDNWKLFLEEFLTTHTMRKARQEIERDEKADAATAAATAVNAVSIAGGYYSAGKNNHAINDKNNHAINDKNNHAINDKNNHAINDKNNHAINDKNNHAINDKNNHSINDKNNHAINDKGLQLLITHFKNIESPWYISGFTKKPEKDEKKRDAEK